MSRNIPSRVPAMSWRPMAWAAVIAAGASCANANAQNAFSQTNLVSDQPGVAAAQDPNLVNAWGIANGPGGPFWISDNGTGLTTVYSPAGATLPLVVTVPAPAGSMPGTTSAPTGQVFTGASGFHQASGASAVFTFVTEDGTISSWNPANGSTAQLMVDHSGDAAVYKGVALGQSMGQSQLYVADFHNNAIGVYNQNFASVSMPSGAFTDPTLPTGYAPFNVYNLNGHIAVSYALQNADKHDDVAGAGHGYVDLYSTAGAFEGRLLSGGVLDSPWGMALAPAGFGKFGGDLLVGNFGDGTINAFNPTTGAYAGTLDDSSGHPLTIPGLWGLVFRSDVPGRLFFTAGPDGESHGLFGYVQSVPEPGCLSLLGVGCIALLSRQRVRSAKMGYQA